MSPHRTALFVTVVIAVAHYNNSAEKKQVVRDVLLVKDCQQLLKASRYAEKFVASGRFKGKQTTKVKLHAS